MTTQDNSPVVAAAGSIDNSPELTGMEAKFQEYLDTCHSDFRFTDAELADLKTAFYFGAQALLEEANPLSSLPVLQAEIDAYLNGDEEEEGSDYVNKDDVL